MSYQVLLVIDRPPKAKKRSSENTSKKQESSITSPELSLACMKKAINPITPSIFSKRIWGHLSNSTLKS